MGRLPRRPQDGTTRPSIVDAGILGGLLMIFTFGSVAQALAGPWTALTSSTARVEISPVEYDVHTTELPGGILISPTQHVGSAYLEVPDLPGTLRFLASAGPSLGWLAWAVGFALVGSVVRAIGRGTPFAPHVPRRIVALAGVVVLGPVAHGVLTWWAGTAVVDHVERSGAVIPYALYAYPPQVLPVKELVVAALVLVVAQAFRQGRRMSGDLEGLV